MKRGREMKGTQKRQHDNTVRRDRLTGRGRALSRFWFTDAVRFFAYRVFFSFYYFTRFPENPEPVA